MNTVDLLFIVDVTGSMSGFISDAKQKMKFVLSSLKKQFEIDLKVGLSLYRDHLSQDTSFVTAVFDLASIDEVKDKIDKITVGGGGDHPEAVIDGIIDGITDMKWREDSRRIAFLIGDAPAHGMIYGESCCQCGQTWGKAVACAEKHKVTIYSILLSGDEQARLNFKLISNFTGGLLIESDNAMDVIVNTLTTEFGNVNLDSKILEMMANKFSNEDICKMLNVDRDELADSKSRIAQYASTVLI